MKVLPKLVGVAMLAAIGAMPFMVAPAGADEIVSYDISETGGSDISGTISFTLGSLDSDSTAYYIDGVSGEINGVNITGVTGYYGAGLGGDVVYQSSPGLFSGWSIANNFGVSLSLADTDTTNINFVPESGDYYQVDASTTGFLYGDTFTLSPQSITAVPVPASWTLMLMSLAGFGFAAYCQRTQNTGCVAS